MSAAEDFPEIARIADGVGVSVLEDAERQARLVLSRIDQLERDQVRDITQRDHAESWSSNPLPRNAAHPRIAALDDVLEAYCHRGDPEVVECGHCLVNAGVHRPQFDAFLCDSCVPVVRFATYITELEGERPVE